MPSDSPNAETGFIPDPGKRIRGLVVLFLRLSIGIPMLGSGLAQYTGAGGPGMRGNVGLFVQPPQGFEALLAAIPYVNIAVALALILGFLTVVSTAVAAFLQLLGPTLHTLTVLMGLSSGVAANRFMGLPPDFYMLIGGGSSYLGLALLLWLSPTSNNLFSLDTLIFQRESDSEAVRAPESVPAPEPGSAENVLTITD